VKDRLVIIRLTGQKEGLGKRLECAQGLEWRRCGVEDVVGEVFFSCVFKDLGVWLGSYRSMSASEDLAAGVIMGGGRPVTSP